MLWCTKLRMVHHALPNLMGKILWCINTSKNMWCMLTQSNTSPLQNSRFCSYRLCNSASLQAPLRSPLFSSPPSRTPQPATPLPPPPRKPTPPLSKPKIQSSFPQPNSSPPTRKPPSPLPTLPPKYSYGPTNLTASQLTQILLGRTWREGAYVKGERGGERGKEEGERAMVHGASNLTWYTTACILKNEKKKKKTKKVKIRLEHASSTSKNANQTCYQHSFTTTGH